MESSIRLILSNLVFLRVIFSHVKWIGGCFYTRQTHLKACLMSILLYFSPSLVELNNIFRSSNYNALREAVDTGGAVDKEFKS
jgi:hypothetical protein